VLLVVDVCWVVCEVVSDLFVVFELVVVELILFVGYWYVFVCVVVDEVEYCKRVCWLYDYDDFVMLLCDGFEYFEYGLVVVEWVCLCYWVVLVDEF